MDHFLPFYWKIKILKKRPGDIISLHLCTTNDNHMMYGSLDIRCNGQSFLWTNFDKMKNTTRDIIIFYMCTINKNNMMYVSSHMKHDRKTFMSFLASFYPFTPLTTPKIEILKKWNKNLEKSLFYPCALKIRIRWCMVPEILAWRTDWCFSLKIYGFCSSNALYLESLQSISTRMFDAFDNRDHFFESNHSLELLVKVVL